MEDKTTPIEKCGLLQTHLNEWSAFTLPNQDFSKTELYFGEAYENILTSGSRVSVPGTVTNAQKLSDDKDGSITTITDVMTTI